MASDYLPKPDEDLAAWAENYVTVANANHVALSLTVSEITDLTTDVQSFTTGLTNHTAAVGAAKSARTIKDESRVVLIADVRASVRKIQANPSVEPSMKRQLGINPRDARPVHTAPTIPLRLSAQGYDTGTNTLEWDRNGNKPTTQFIVEARIGAAASYVIVGVTSKTKFDHTGQNPGVKVSYRVYAQRDEMQSDYSNVTVVYDTGSGTGNPLTLEKAA